MKIQISLLIISAILAPSMAESFFRAPIKFDDVLMYPLHEGVLDTSADPVNKCSLTIYVNELYGDVYNCKKPVSTSEAPFGGYIKRSIFICQGSVYPTVSTSQASFFCTVGHNGKNHFIDINIVKHPLFNSLEDAKKNHLSSNVPAVNYCDFKTRAEIRVHGLDEDLEVKNCLNPFERSKRPNNNNKKLPGDATGTLYGFMQTRTRYCVITLNPRRGQTKATMKCEPRFKSCTCQNLSRMFVSPKDRYILLNNEPGLIAYAKQKINEEFHPNLSCDCGFD